MIISTILVSSFDYSHSSIVISNSKLLKDDATVTREYTSRPIVLVSQSVSQSVRMVRSLVCARLRLVQHSLRVIHGAERRAIT